MESKRAGRERWMRSFAMFLFTYLVISDGEDG
jgi:hypothetical protein